MAEWDGGWGVGGGGAKSLAKGCCFVFKMAQILSFKSTPYFKEHPYLGQQTGSCLNCFSL